MHLLLLAATLLGSPPAGGTPVEFVPPLKLDLAGWGPGRAGGFGSVPPEAISTAGRGGLWLDRSAPPSPVPARPVDPTFYPPVQSRDVFLGDPGMRATLACLGSAILPGLGHAASGRFLDRGIAFTAAFLLGLFSGVGSVLSINDMPALAPQLTAAGVTLFILTEVVYVWALVDALMVAVSPEPAPERWAPPGPTFREDAP